VLRLPPRLVSRTNSGLPVQTPAKKEPHKARQAVRPRGSLLVAVRQPVLGTAQRAPAIIWPAFLNPLPVVSFTFSTCAVEERSRA